MNHYNSNEIISMGSNCAPGIALRELGLKGKTYPFDWIISNPSIILDVLQNGYEKYLTFEHKNFKEEDRDPIIEDFFRCLFQNSIQNFQHQRCTLNCYGQYFTHYISQRKLLIIDKFQRYFERFFNAIQENKRLLFIKSSEEYIYHKKSRDNSEKYYQDLVKVSECIHELNPDLEFKILNIEINNSYENTEYIHNENLEFPLDLSDNCEFHDGEHYGFYRNAVREIIKNYNN